MNRDCLEGIASLVEDMVDSDEGMVFVESEEDSPISLEDAKAFVETHPEFADCILINEDWSANLDPFLTCYPALVDRYDDLMGAGRPDFGSGQIEYSSLHEVRVGDFSEDGPLDEQIHAAEVNAISEAIDEDVVAGGAVYVARITLPDGEFAKPCKT